MPAPWTTAMMAKKPWQSCWVWDTGRELFRKRRRSILSKLVSHGRSPDFFPVVGFVEFSDNDSHFHRGVRVQIHEFEADKLLVAIQDARLHLNADFLARFVDSEFVGLITFAVGLLRLHHETAAADLPQHANLLTLALQHHNLRVAGDIHSFKSPPFARWVLFGGMFGH